MVRNSQLMRDLKAFDAIQASLNRQVGPPVIPVVTRVDNVAPDVEPIVSAPVEGIASDHYRMGSPNRSSERGRDDTRMRHRRLKRR